MNYVGKEPAPAGVVLVGDTNPVGMIVWQHAVPDASYLALNGQQVQKATYPDLWTWAQGFLTADQVNNPGLYLSVDANNFKVPNLSGLFVRGTGQYDASRVAGALGAFQSDKLGQTGSNIQVPDFNFAGGAGVAGGGQLQRLIGADNRPANVALVPCVKALKTFIQPANAPAFPTLSYLTNSLVANIALNVAGQWFDGPQVAQGPVGIWLASGNITMIEPGAVGNFHAKLYDGTTVVDSGGQVTRSGDNLTMHLSGVFVNPTGNIRMAGRDNTTAAGTMLWDITGGGVGKSCTVTAVRIG